VNPRASPGLPLGLCGLLVVAAGLALFPRWVEPIEGPARWLMCLPLRVWPGSAAHAAPPPAPVAARAAGALARIDADALAGAAPLFAAGAVPLVCRVLERRGGGGGRLPTRLVLDRTVAELAGSLGLVTRGSALVGFLEEPDPERAGASTLAVVRCVHAPHASAPRRLLAAAAFEDGEPLRFVVEPGSRIDPWPLRIGLLEDPYRASRVQAGGVAVRTLACTVGSVAVPEGLDLGVLRVWGYAGDASDVLPVGFFVEPAFDARAVVTVVVWRPAAAAREAGAPGDDIDYRLAHGALLPPGLRAFLLTGREATPEGAAVVGRDGQLFGLVEAAGPGDAVAASFATPGRTWSLLLVPDDPDRAPVECTAQVLGARGAQVDVRLASPVPPFSGEVLTGAQGLHCPAGLRVGRIASLDASGRVLGIARAADDVGAVTVCVRRERTP